MKEERALAQKKRVLLEEQRLLQRKKDFGKGTEALVKKERCLHRKRGTCEERCFF